MSQNVRWFEEICLKDLPNVGGKNASLGEMIKCLKPKGVNIPDGFCTTSEAYRSYVKHHDLEPKIREILQNLDSDDIQGIQECGRQVRQLILKHPLPKDITEAISQKYAELCQKYGTKREKDGRNFYTDVDVAVRSSATAEDLPTASFAGQQESYLHIHGVDRVLESTLKCYASLFTDRAISYRTHKDFDHFDVAISVGIQKMVRSDEGSAGVIFTIDTETGFEDVVLLTGSFGLGEMVVQGEVNPDEFVVFKPTLKKGFKPILSKRLGSKENKMIYSHGGSTTTKVCSMPPQERDSFCISDEQILKLSEWACLIEDHYSQLHKKSCPMDIEWARDGSGELFIVQARPETVESAKKKDLHIDSYHLDESGQVLTKGQAIGRAVVCGNACVLKKEDMKHFKEGAILVTDRTDPDWEPIMKKAAAIITNQGGRTCHAAIIARELGLPAIVGCSNANHILPNGKELTVSCCEGAQGRVYEGALKYHVDKIQLSSIPKLKTKIMMNVGNPDEAFTERLLPNQGVGLARLEFIIANDIQIHPMALIDFDAVKDEKARKKIIRKTRGYADKADYFIEKLATGVAMIAAAFYPSDVVVRLSDFKTNEYASLIGGTHFEPHEENPMIGWRGASRYYDPKYEPAFKLECCALWKVRNEMGLKNVIPMVPFCRTLDEGRKVLSVMQKYGLKRGQDGLKVYVMCEVPSNVILADEFCSIFDGFSIGSNDLTQLTLGLDRDSAILATQFDEQNEAVKRAIQQVIGTCQNHGTKIGICGQAPSDYPDFCRFLVDCGIDSISLSPDTVLSTTLDIARFEKEAGWKEAHIKKEQE